MVVMTYAWFDVTRNAKNHACHNDHKTYTWNDVILYNRSMIRVFEFNFRFLLQVLQYSAWLFRFFLLSRNDIIAARRVIPSRLIACGTAT